jgi:hypothetical protein
MAYWSARKSCIGSTISFEQAVSCGTTSSLPVHDHLLEQDRLNSITQHCVISSYEDQILAAANSRVINIFNLFVPSVL